MKCEIYIADHRKVQIDLEDPIPIGIPFKDRSPLRCFGAPPLSFDPLISGDFTGAIEAGAPVNFYNVKWNPHGNGTHTESVRHISNLPVFIGEIPGKQMFFARLITVRPEENDKGDLVISSLQMKEILSGSTDNIEALIVRTLPNAPAKMNTDYTDTNPPYFDPKALDFVRESGIHHLLTDLPSVDREQDGGQLAAHKAFWNYPSNPRTTATITELIYVPDTIPDGLYMLYLQILQIQLDACPTSPVIYAITQPEI